MTEKGSRDSENMKKRGKTLVDMGSHRGRVWAAALLLLSLLVMDAGCFLNQEITPYYGRIVVPRKQEFRWSDGGLPQVFDPAFAAAPPDTDAVRALFEGLTDYDPQTLKPVPAVATRWESSADGRLWTFYLRKDARWSSGEPVTAMDFVRSWQRTLKLGDLAPHTELLNNIVGARPSIAAPSAKPEPESTIQKIGASPNSTNQQKKESVTGELIAHFGAEAVDDHVLRVRLQRADPNFPALVAHPVFRPVKTTGADANTEIAAAHVVSNGAFQLAKSGRDTVLLERAENYWGKADVSLERVEFVGGRDAESALAAYRNGEVDAVTNATFEPLALKLLAPYKDYHRATYGALTYYSFNTSQAPFDDVRVREALAIAIDRERISEHEMGGATEPAKKFLPGAITDKTDEPVVAKSALLEQDVAQARRLFGEAGYPNGKNFPRIRLLINRNEQQRQVAQAIAVMWHSALNVETEIIVKNWDDYEVAIRAGDYDLVRRGIVMQTTDELTNIRLLFPAEVKAEQPHAESTQSGSSAPGVLHDPAKDAGVSGAALPEKNAAPPIESETEALSQLRAIPIYFASSYTLVRPYVIGFDTNILDAPSLKKVRIDSGWQEPKTAGVVWSR
jgi:oligopeptide transport system substrate-binding protein